MASTYMYAKLLCLLLMICEVEREQSVEGSTRIYYSFLLSPVYSHVSMYRRTAFQAQHSNVVLSFQPLTACQESGQRRHL